MSLASRKLIQATAGAAGAVDTGDDDFANVVLLLDGDGTSGDNNETFTDSSTNGFTVTETGSVVQGSFSPYGNNWSVYFDGSSYLDTGSGATALGTGAFTVEFWINTTDTSFNIMNPDSSTGNGFWGLMVQSGDLRWNNQYNLTNLWVVDGAPILDGQWHHVAIVSSSSVFKVFYDGVSQSIQSGSFTDSYNYPYNDGLRIGSGNLATFKGYLSNIRLVSGTAIYSSDFDVPTEPFTNSTSYTEKLLACQSNRFIDNGNSSYSITTSGSPKVTPFSPFKDDDARTLTTDGGSGYFDDSSNSYLQIADNSAFDATASLCIEAWFYMTSSPGSGPDAHAVVSKWVSTTPGQRTIFIDIENTGLRVYADLQGASNPVLITTDGGAIPLYSWHHVAVTWDGSTYRAFLDGALEGSTSSSRAPVASSQVVRVGHNTNTHYFGGYITNARWVTDGGAIYTSNFTPPTSPLTAVTNTELLLNFQDAGIYDRTGINNLDTVGNAQIDTAVKKYGTGSLEFDGTGDYLEAVYPSGLYDGFDDMDWTIEAWVYPKADADDRGGIVELYTTDTHYIRLMYVPGSTSGKVDFQFAGNGFNIQSGNKSELLWHHVAGVSYNGTLTLYVNGTAIGSDSGYNLAGVVDPRVVIGLDLVSTDRYTDGYIDDVRITKGIARYTSNFTPPSAELPKF